MDHRWNFLERFLSQQTRSGLLRVLRPLSSIKEAVWVKLDDRWLLNLASNDYLGLRGDPRLAAAAAGAAARWGTGSGSSRLVSGTTSLHEEVERELAGFHRSEAALTFSSGYAAGVGVVPALVGRGDRVYLDRLCHACLYDGALLSGARIRRYRHNDPAHLEELLEKDSTLGGRALVLTDSVFSMDGDRAPLAEIAAICRRYSCLFLADEAHAVGVLGPGGRGLAAEAGLDSESVLTMGTLGKAFGVSGAYLVGAARVREYFINTCRSFIYSTAPPPPLLAAVGAALKIVKDAENLRKRLSRIASQLRHHLQALGLDTLKSTTQIVPAVLGDTTNALRFSENLKEHGVFAPAIRPPTVPQGTSRVRFSLSSALTDRDFDFLLEAVRKAIREL